MSWKKKKNGQTKTNDVSIVPVQLFRLDFMTELFAGAQSTVETFRRSLMTVVGSQPDADFIQFYLLLTRIKESGA